MGGICLLVSGCTKYNILFPTDARAHNAKYVPKFVTLLSTDFFQTDEVFKHNVQVRPHFYSFAT